MLPLVALRSVSDATFHKNGSSTISTHMSEHQLGSKILQLGCLLEYFIYDSSHNYMLLKLKLGKPNYYAQ